MITPSIRAATIAIAALFVAGGAAADPIPAKPGEEARAFLDLVRANFDRWDVTHQGRLTAEDVDVDMQNPKIKGDAAAALAGLKWSMKKGKDAEASRKAFTLADLDAMDKALADGGKIDKAALAHFIDGRKKLQAEARQLYSAGVPHLAAIRQDSTYDCYFNSAVGSLAQASAQNIMKLIQQNPDGTFTVTFPGKAPEKVPAPTDSEIAAYSDASDGVWFNVLEKAYAKIRPIKPAMATKEPLDAAALIGGDGNAVMALVSGHQTEVLRFPLKSGHAADERFLAEVRADLAGAFHDHRAVVTGKYHHAFAVVAFDPRTDTVTIHNPYDGNGGEGLPDGESDFSSGGFFSISTVKFVENFNDMGVEQAALTTR